MKVFLGLTETSSQASDYLEKKVGENLSKKSLQIFRNAEDLAWMLRRPWSRCEIAILVAANNRELDRFLTLRSLLKDVKVILILPDREPATALKGHKLYPRFISYIDNDLKEVLAVLKKMLQQLQSNNRNPNKESHNGTNHQGHGSGC
jgi:hypothetical protein